MSPELLHKNNAGTAWGHWLLDLVDCDVICDIPAPPKVLPVNAHQASLPSSNWTNEQTAGGNKLAGHDRMSTLQAQGSFYVTGVDTFSPMKQHYLVGLRSLRKRCHDSAKDISEAERTCQEKRKREKQAWEKNAEDREGCSFGKERR